MSSTKRIGLALGGGAAKGWAHIGFIQALIDAEITPDIVTGTSIGAVSGGCWAAGKLDYLEEFARSLTPRRVFSLMDVSLSGSGLINGGRLGELLSENLANIDIKDLSVPFTCMATELANGNEIWLTEGPLAPALQASYALPGIFKPVEIDNRWLVDGALVNPVPVSACRSMGADFVIAVSLSTQGIGHGTIMSKALSTEMKAETETPHEEELHTAKKQPKRSAAQMLRRQILGERNGPPGISAVMMQSYNIIQDRITRSRLAGDPPDLLIKPMVDEIGMFDFHRADEAIKAGYKAAEPVIATLSAQRDLLSA